MAEEVQQGYNYGKRPLWQWIVLYVIIGAVVYGLVYYFVFANKSTSNQSSNPYQAPSSTQTTQPTSSPSATTGQSITVSGNEFTFTPSTVTAKVGQPITLTFKNMGKYPHNLSIADLGVATKTIQPGQEDSVTFTPSKTGTFSFKCTVDSHAEKGMTGTLTVE